jgi:hypothetical protein
MFLFLVNFYSKLNDFFLYIYSIDVPCWLCVVLFRVTHALKCLYFCIEAYFMEKGTLLPIPPTNERQLDLNYTPHRWRYLNAKTFADSNGNKLVLALIPTNDCESVTKRGPTARPQVICTRDRINTKKASRKVSFKTFKNRDPRIGPPPARRHILCF